MAPTGDLDHNPGMHPDQESNRRPFSSQADVQPAKPLQPGMNIFILTKNQSFHPCVFFFQTKHLHFCLFSHKTWFPEFSSTKNLSWANYRFLKFWLAGDSAEAMHTPGVTGWPAWFIPPRSWSLCFYQ